MRTVLVMLLVGCLKNGGDGPQMPYSKPTDLPGECDGCYVSTVSLGLVTAIVGGMTIAARVIDPKHEIDRRAYLAGIGLGVSTLAIGTTHAVLNRDQLASQAIVPGIVGVAVGIPTIVNAAIGLRQGDVTATPISVPGGGGVGISGRF